MTRKIFTNVKLYNRPETEVEFAIERGKTMADNPDGDYYGNGYGLFAEIDETEKDSYKNKSLYEQLSKLTLDSSSSKYERQRTSSTEPLSTKSNSSGDLSSYSEEGRVDIIVPHDLKRSVPQPSIYISDISQSSGSSSAYISNTSWRNKISQEREASSQDSSMQFRLDM